MNYKKTIPIKTTKDFLVTRKYSPWQKTKEEKSQLRESIKNTFEDKQKEDNRRDTDLFSRNSINRYNMTSASIAIAKKTPLDKQEVLWEAEVLNQKQRDKVFDENKEKKFNETKTIIYNNVTFFKFKIIFFLLFLV